MTHESSTLMGYALMTPIFGQLRVTLNSAITLIWDFNERYLIYLIEL